MKKMTRSIGTASIIMGTMMLTISPKVLAVSFYKVQTISNNTSSVANGLNLSLNSSAQQVWIVPRSSGNQNLTSKNPIQGAQSLTTSINTNSWSFNGFALQPNASIDILIKTSNSGNEISPTSNSNEWLLNGNTIIGSNPFGKMGKSQATQPNNFGVPEPLTILGAGTAIAFGAGFKRKLAESKNQ